MPFALHTLCIQIWVSWVHQDGFPHSEIFGSKLDWQLPEAYGSLPPPSSPSDTKASTRRSFQLTTSFWQHIIVIKFAYLLRRSDIYIYKYFKDHKKFFITTHKLCLLHRKILVVEMSGIEPLTFRMQIGRSTSWATSPKFISV